MSIFKLVADPAPTPSGLNAKSRLGSILLNWDENKETQSTLIYESKTNNRAASSLLGETKENTFTVSVSSVDPRYYWIRHRSTVGLDNGDFFPADVSAGVSAFSSRFSTNDLTDNSVSIAGVSALSSGTDAALTSAYGAFTKQIEVNFNTDDRVPDHIVINFAGVWDQVFFTQASTASVYYSLDFRLECSAPFSTSFISNSWSANTGVATPSAAHTKRDFISFSRIYKERSSGSPLLSNAEYRASIGVKGQLANGSPILSTNKFDSPIVSYQIIYK